MEVKIQIKEVVYSICIGYKTHWFGQLSFITIAKEWYENKQVCYAILLYRS